MDNKKIGLFIAGLRKEKNMTQKDLADKLFVSDKAVSKWERGLSMPDIGLIDKLATILEVNVSEILKGERIGEMTKKRSDEIVKESIPFYQKKYFKNKILRIVLGIITFLIVGYFLLLCIGELSLGSLNWTLFGTEYSMDLPSFSAKKDKRNSEYFLEALKKYDYNTIEKILKENPNGTISREDINFDEYIDNLKELKKDNFKIIDYKYIWSYFRDSGYASTFDIVFIYDNVKYTMSPQILGYGNGIIVEGIGWTSNDAFKVNNPISNLEVSNNEMYKKIEKIFEY